MLKYNNRNNTMNCNGVQKSDFRKKFFNKIFNNRNMDNIVQLDNIRTGLIALKNYHISADCNKVVADLIDHVDNIIKNCSAIHRPVNFSTASVVGNNLHYNSARTYYRDLISIRANIGDDSTTIKFRAVLTLFDQAFPHLPEVDSLGQRSPGAGQSNSSSPGSAQAEEHLNNSPVSISSASTAESSEIHNVSIATRNSQPDGTSMDSMNSHNDSCGEGRYSPPPSKVAKK